MKLEMFLTYMGLKMGFRFIWRCQIVEFAFLRYVNSLDEPNISLGELSFLALAYFVKFWILTLLTVGSS